MQIIESISRIINTLFRRRSSYLDFCFIYLCVWTLLSVGGQAQYYIFKFIGSDSSTLYGSAFENAIAKIPSLNQQIIFSYSITDNYHYIAAFFIIVTSLFFRSSLQIFFASIISSVFSLTITDIAYLYSNDTLTSKAIIECFIANLIGSPVISSFVVFLFSIKNNLMQLNSINIKIRHLSSYFCYLMICITIVVSSYYVICFFYRPTSVNFNVSTSQEFSGNYIINNKKTISGEDKNQDGKIKFSILGKPAKIGSEVQLSGKIREVNANFREGESYNLTFSLLSNCLDSNVEKTLPSKSYTYKNVRAFSLKPSEDISIVWIGDKNGHIKLTDELVNMFSVKEDGKKGYIVNKTNDGTASYYPSDTDGAIYIATPVIDYSKNESRKIATFTININGGVRKINVETERPRSISKNKRFKCENLAINNLNDSLNLEKSEAMVIGLAIKIEPNYHNEFYPTEITDKTSHFEFKGELLSLINNNASKENLLKENFTDGYMDGIILHSFEKLSLNGKNIESNKMDNIIAIGDEIYSHTSLDNNLVSTGKVGLFYRNRLRENKTLWEDSSDNTLIIGGIGALILSLLTLAIKMMISTLRRDENINIL